MQEENTYELTNPQKSIWITEQFYKGTAINNICGTAVIKENVDFELLEKSILLVMEKYDIFKTTFSVEKSNIKQTITSKYNKKIDIIEMENEKELKKYQKSIVSEPFNLLNSYLYNFYIIKFINNQGAFMLNIHHLIADAWTLGFISREIIKIYSKLKTNSYVEETLKYSYKQYIETEKEYVESEKYKKDKKYWESKFNRVPSITSIECEQKKQAENTSEAQRENFKIDKKLINKINKYCEKKNISLYNFFMAVYAIYISEISNLNRFVIGTPILNRTNRKEKQIPGMFISTQAFLIDLEDVEDFDTFLKKIVKESYNMLKHQRYPYQKILEYARRINKNIPNLYNILLSYQITNAQNKEENIKYITDWTFNGNSSDNLAIHIYDINDSGYLNIAYDYKINLFSRQEIKNIHYRILYIIKQVISKENIELKDIEVVTQKEKKELIYKFNDTKIEYDKNVPIIKYFEKQAKRHPKDIALVFENATMTYEELNERANSLANLLRKKKVRNNTVVGIMEHRSFEMIVAIIAVLKAGGAFIPIAPEYPDSRIEYMLEDSNTEILLTEKSLKDRVKFNKEKIFITLDNSDIYNFNKKNIANISKKDDLSYIIYTSGSTGKPKGVMLTQKNLTNFYHSMVKKIDYLSLKKKLQIVSITTLSFDIFLFETLISLTRGLRVYITNYYEQKITSKLERLIKDHKVEILQTTPSVLNFHLDNLQDNQGFSNLKYIMLAGEQLPKQLVDKIKKVAPSANIYNGYGPSETTIFSCVENVTTLDKITIGKPIGNTFIYVLNKNKKLIPKNYAGEMYISGDGVGKGYINREVLTTERFSQNPFNKKLIMYETGDIGRWQQNGRLECKGRVDHQIKLNGLRIELGEIEETINSFKEDNLKSAIILKNNGEKETLNAFISYPYEIDIQELKRYLLAHLPSYMIPNTYNLIEELPFTPNGKIDRKALESYDVDDSYENEKISVPRNNTEKILLKTIKNKLNVKKFGIDSNIFDYGADSLTIINIMTDLFKYNFNVKVFDLYKYPTVRELYDNLLDQNLLRKNFDYDRYERLNKTVKRFSRETNAKIINKKYNVLLTGATGFFGCHLLADLLESPEKINKVYCTMRPKKNITPKDRLLNKVKFYFGDKYNHLFDKYVQIVECQISEDNFEMSKKEYTLLQDKIDIAIHSAANVNHYGKYASFEKTNVNGTSNLISFCKKKNIPLHYISTMTVSGNYLLKQDEKKDSFNENSFYTGQNFEQNVYSKSKLIAESLVIEYISNGGVATIYRLGDLTGRYLDGVFQENINQNAIYLRLKSILEIGYVSNTILRNNLEFSPVDFTSLAVKDIIWSDKCKNRIFNIYNPNMVSTQKLLSFMKESKYLITVLPKEEFAKLIERLSQNSENQEKLMGIINDFTEDRDLVYNYTIKEQNEITCKYLESLGFEWPKIDEEYLKKVLDYMKKVNFIK